MQDASQGWANEYQDRFEEKDENWIVAVYRASQPDFTEEDWEVEEEFGSKQEDALTLYERLVGEGKAVRLEVYDSHGKRDIRKEVWPE